MKEEEETRCTILNEEVRRAEMVRILGVSQTKRNLSHNLLSSDRSQKTLKVETKMEGSSEDLFLENGDSQYQLLKS